MIFQESQPIYIQLLEMINNSIISGDWEINCLIPSVRELAAQYEVNPKTVSRVYDILQNNGVIIKQRGMGFLLSPDAKEKTLALVKEEFIKNDVPRFLNKLKQLGMNLDDISDNL